MASKASGVADTTCCGVMAVLVALAFSPVAAQQTNRNDWNVGVVVRSDGPHGFSVVVHDNSTFNGVVYPVFKAVFSGKCSEVASVQVTVSREASADLQQFRTSRLGSDLPIKPHLQAMQQTLLRQCANLQVIRFTFDRAGVNFYGYEGTLTRSGGWALQDGYIASEFDASAEVTVNMGHSSGRLRVFHRGTCGDTEPTLLVEPVPNSLIDRRGLTLLLESLQTAERAVQRSRLVAENLPFAGTSRRDFRARREGRLVAEWSRLAIANEGPVCTSLLTFGSRWR